MADDAAMLEEQKKLVLPFMQRAQEVQKADPKVAYYCRLFAVDQALKFPQRHKEINGLVVAALSALEKDKERLGLDKEADRVHCEAFALRIFGNADRVDRQGKADMNTSKAYYAAVFFIEILNQFQTLDADFSSKQKYAAWRASEIRKALREGRPPVPPTQDEVRQAQEEQEMATLDQALPSAPAPGPAPPTEGLAGLSIAGANIAGANVAPQSASSSNSHETVPQPPRPPSYDGAPMAPPIPPPMPAPAPAMPPDVQRFWQGSPVYYCPAPNNMPIEAGTVGVPLPGGRYMVGLQDRLVEAEDGQLAPAVQPGGHVSFMPFPGGPLLPAEVLMMDNMGWPPSYLVRPQNGKEQAAGAHQIAMLPLSPQPTQHSRDGSVRSGVSASHSNSSLHSLQHQQQQQQQQPHVPQPSPPIPPVSPPPFPGTTSPPPPTGPYPGMYTPPMGPPYNASPPPIPPQPPAPAFQHQPPAPAQPPMPATAPAAPRPLQPASSAPTFHAPPQAAKGLPINVINDAQKKAKYAVSSLNFEDVHSAIKYLSEALQLLTTNPR